MKVSEVRVQYYRSIIDTGWVDIESGITTLIGKNESGKTSFLRAIESFSNDGSYSDRELSDNLDQIDESIPIISLKIEIEGNDQQRLEKIDDIELDKPLIARKYVDGSKKVTTSDGDDIQLQSKSQLVDETKDIISDVYNSLNKLQNQHTGQFRGHFNKNIKNRLKKIKNSNREDPEWYSDQISELREPLKQIPEQSDDISREKRNFIEYIDRINHELTQSNKIADISGLVPSFVYYNAYDTIDDSVDIDSINDGDHRTFRNLLSLVNLGIDDFQSADQFEQNKMLDKADGQIEGHVNNYWKQKSVGVTISYRGNQFTVQIKDEELQKRESNVGRSLKKTSVSRELQRPSDRSKGFQWFFSFYINFHAETEDRDGEDVVLLLDDPAVYLHPEGKKDWLSAIEEIAENEQVIFTSHSPFLIRKEYPSRIRIINDNSSKGSTVTSDFANSDSMTLEPLRNALGIGLGDSPFVSQRKILVEGPSDLYYINAISKYYRDVLDTNIIDINNITILSTNGGNNMVYAAKWVASEEFSYILLLDKDDKGKEVEQDIIKNHHEIDQNRILFLERDDSPQNFHFEIEDVFDPVFYIDCVNEAYEEYDHYTPIEINQQTDPWEIEGVEYKQCKLVSKLNTVFDKRDYGNLDKIRVAKIISERLRQNRDVNEDDIVHFKPILGEIRNAL